MKTLPWSQRRRRNFVSTTHVKRTSTQRRRWSLARTARELCPKVKSKVQQPPISWNERGRPDVHIVGVNQQVHVEQDPDDFRWPVPGFKIPHKPKDNRRRHFQVTKDRSPSTDFRHGRFGSFGRGYVPNRGRGHGKPRSLPFSRPERIPGLTPEEKECINRMRRSCDSRY